MADNKKKAIETQKLKSEIANELGQGNSNQNNKSQDFGNLQARGLVSIGELELARKAKENNNK